MPSSAPTVVHSKVPSSQPSTLPSSVPSFVPSSAPTVLHSDVPSVEPSPLPTSATFSALIDGVYDTSIAGSAPNWSGHNGQLYCRTSDPSQAMFYFDLSVPPVGAVVESAELYLTGGNNVGVFYAYGILPGVNWMTGTYTWNSAGNGLQVGVEVDLNPTGSSTVQTTIPGVPGWTNYRRKFDVTSLVQSWVDNSFNNNNGIAILPGPDGNDVFMHDTHPATSVRPKLLITWSVPAPLPTNSPTAYSCIDRWVLYECGVDNVIFIADFQPGTTVCRSQMRTKNFRLLYKPECSFQKVEFRFTGADTYTKTEGMGLVFSNGNSGTTPKCPEAQGHTTYPGGDYFVTVDTYISIDPEVIETDYMTFSVNGSC